MPRATKIVATLGPACSDPAVLQRMLAAGVDVVRLNFSHGNGRTITSARARMVREAAHKLGREIAIMADLQGPKIRVGKFADGKVDARGRPAVRPRRRMRARRRQARRPRLQGAAAGRRAAAPCCCSNDGLIQLVVEARRRPADRHQGRAGRRAVEQQGHQPAGRRPDGARADGQGHGRREDGGDARGRLPRRLVPEEQGRHVHGAPAAARRRRQCAADRQDRARRGDRRAGGDHRRVRRHHGRARRPRRRSRQRGGAGPAEADDPAWRASATS